MRDYLRFLQFFDLYASLISLLIIWLSDSLSRTGLSWYTCSCSFSIGASVCYAYDKSGNRIKKTDCKGATLYRFNGKNQLIAEESSNGKNQFTYNRQGYIVEEKNYTGIRLFSYNSRHQQTKVETATGNVQEDTYRGDGLNLYAYCVYNPVIYYDPSVLLIKGIATKEAYEIFMEMYHLNNVGMKLI